MLDFHKVYLLESTFEGEVVLRVVVELLFGDGRFLYFLCMFCCCCGKITTLRKGWLEIALSLRWVSNGWVTDSDLSINAGAGPFPFRVVYCSFTWYNGDAIMWGKLHFIVYRYHAARCGGMPCGKSLQSGKNFKLDSVILCKVSVKQR